MRAVRRVGGSNGRLATDRELVDAHLAGDPMAFARIVGRYHADMVRVALRRLRNTADADDAVQDALVRALNGLGRVSESDEELRLGAWLVRIVHNVCLDQVAQRRLRAQRIGPEDPHDLGSRLGRNDPDNDFLAHAQLIEVVEDLPRPLREAFVLREIDGMAYADVAQVAGVTEVNARARVRRARVTLQRRVVGAGIRPAALVATAWVGQRVLRRRRSVAPSHVLTAARDSLARSTVNAVSGPVGQVMAAVSATPRGTILVGMVATAASLGAATTVITASPAPRVAVGVAASPTTRSTHGSPAVPSNAAAEAATEHAAGVTTPSDPAGLMAGGAAGGIAAGGAATSLAPPTTLAASHHLFTPIGHPSAPVTTAAPPTTLDVPSTSTTSLPPDSTSSSTTTPAAGPVTDLTWLTQAESGLAPSPPASVATACAALPASAPGAAPDVGVEERGTVDSGVVPATAGDLTVMDGSAPLRPVSGGPDAATTFAAKLCITGPPQVMADTVTVTGSGAAPVTLSLEGSLVATISTPQASGGLFRGTATAPAGVTLPAGAGADFVAQYVAWPARGVCQLTVVFLAAAS